jgi:serine/threonine protein kinase
MGDLEVYLHNRKNEVTNDFRFTVASDIADGLQFLHAQAPPIVHRDLKSPNVLVRGRAERERERESERERE